MAEHRIERLGQDGDGVASGPKGQLFVRGALPGDVVHIGKVRKDGSIVRADLTEVVTPSPDRVASACAIAARCGGCPLMAASPSLSARFKEEQAARALAAGGYTGPLAIEAPSPTLAYRQRTRLAFVGTQRGVVLGYHPPGAKEIVDVPACAVLTPPLAAALTWARTALATLAGKGELHLGSVGSGADARASILITTESAQPAAIYRALEQAVKDGALGGATLRAMGTAPVRFGESDEASVDVDGRALRWPVGGFRQAHAEAPARLGRAVLELGQPEGKRVLELHAGHGSFSLALAARAASVTAVEVDAAAADALRANLSAHSLSAEVVVRDASQHLQKLAPAARRAIELVVLDPPRTGARDAVEALAGLSARVVYVSCNPRTLGRDLAVAREHGFVVTAARVFDLFPKTAHVETVCLLERTGQVGSPGA